MIIRTKSLSKSYPNKQIFENVNFQINKEDKIALLGLNGAGKTTLLNLITGKDIDYEGHIEIAPNIKTHYLSQILQYQEDSTLIDICKASYKRIYEIQNQIKKIETELDNNNSESLTAKYTKLLAEYDNLRGYDVEIEIEIVLTGLDFKKQDFNRKISSFSGGEQRRIQLAQVLLGKPDFLILDEPTNHLDVFAIEWLENFLLNLNIPLLIVSHDKYFVSKICNKILELEFGTLESYSGNYSYYNDEKKLRYDQRLKSYERQQELIKKEKEFIRRNMAGQKTKQAQSRQKALEKIDLIDKPLINNKELKIRFPGVTRTSKEVFKTHDISKSFDDKILFKNQDLIVYRHDRIALVGENGSGKTTLFKILQEELEIDDGIINIDEKAKIAYFSQGVIHLRDDQTLFDYIHDKYPKLTELEVRNLLGMFYFSGDEQLNLIESLSGGEKSRLAILDFILSGANVLLLDEPTNHLDIMARDSLAKALSYYPGTIFFISHDRHFIDVVARQIWYLKDHNIEKYLGNWSENYSKIFPENTGKKIKTEKANDKTSNNKKKKNINVYKLKKIEDIISELEEKRNILQKEMLKPNIVSDYIRVRDIEKDITNINKKIDNFMIEWEEMQI